MCAAWASSSVTLPDFTRTTTFRWTLVVAGAFGLCILVFSGFVYWEVAADTTSRIDGLLVDELRVIAADSPEQRLEDIDDRLRQVVDGAVTLGAVHRRDWGPPNKVSPSRCPPRAILPSLAGLTTERTPGRVGLHP
jgi:hypothetical protein